MISTILKEKAHPLFLFLFQISEAEKS